MIKFGPNDFTFVDGKKVRMRFNGKGITDRARRAAIAAVNETMAACVEDARRNHPQSPHNGQIYSYGAERWFTHDDELLDSIRIFSPAGRTRTKTGQFQAGVDIGGTWGADAQHAIFVELGTSEKGSGMPTVYQREAMGHGDMHAIPESTQYKMYPRAYPEGGYLRPAADRQYKLLKERLRRHWEADRL